VVVVVGLSAFALGSGYDLGLPARVGGNNNAAFTDLPPEFDRLAEVWEILGRDHIDREQLDPAGVSDGAIRGMVQSLDDPYASFLDAEQFGVESQDFQGFFEGIGAQVAMRDGQVVIIAPMPGTPAQRAGIRPGDIILGIDGESTANISLLEAVSKIRGEKGTTVELLVMHLDTGEPVTMVVERGVIPLNSVSFAMLDGGVGHLRISNFAENTNDEVAAALREFKDSSGVGLVVDLRNNPGGLLRAVVDVASQFLDDGLILYEIDSRGKRTNWEVKSGGDGRGFPMVVLINQFSASASEVLSGALMDHDRAVLVGTTSFGKGSVNTLRPLSDGSGIYFSIARWYTPDGTLIEGEGITPEVVVELPPGATEAEDLQLDKAIEILRKEIAKVG
jgi:carboxyl-terminal processing protease